MKLNKKIGIAIIVVLMLLCGFCQTRVNAASLNDAQRKGLVDTIIKMIDEGNKARILRYSQDQRMSGYNWRKNPASVKQSTAGNTNLIDSDLVRVKNILMREQGVDDIDDLYKMPTTLGYQCEYVGADIGDTISYDCSSLVSAAYNYAVGTPFGGWAWTSGQFSSDSNFFTVSSDVSSAKPGDILWKKGHVALYLGDCYGNGKKYIAEAYGFAKLNKSSAEMRKRLLDFLDQNPTYIKEHPNYNGKRPRLQLPSDGIMEVTKQVCITEFTAGRFEKVATYIGPISAGRAIDLTNLHTTNTGNSGADDGSQQGDGSLGNGGLDHDPINLPGSTTVVWPKNLVLEDQNLATSEGYFYKGTPTYGQYIGRIDMFNWLVEKTGDVLDYLIGVVTYAVKAVIIGWTAIMENIMENILNFGFTPMEGNSQLGFSGEVMLLSKVTTQKYLAYETPNTGTQGEGGSTGTQSNVKVDSEIDASETKKKITVEDVLFNRVPILDINFFDFENAGGEKLSEASLIYKIRSTLAGWYYVIRTAVIMGMLLMLLYTAIKIAISVPSKKAEYKSKLIDWIVGFIIVFSIHYFMVAIINFNVQIVKILDPVIKSSTTVDTPKIESGSNISTQNDGQTSLYEAIRIQSYDIRATTGITAAVMYMVLVFFMIRFVVLYAKRLFVLALLTVVSPIMGLLYSLNKKKYKLGDWGKEYIYNVLIQFVHVVIYTAIVGLAFDISKTATFKGGLIALVTLGFMYGAEDLVKKIFGFNKVSSGNLSGSAIGSLAAVGATKVVYDKINEKTKKAVTTFNSDDNWFRRKYNERLHKAMSMSDWEKKNNISNQFTPANGMNGESADERRKRRAETVVGLKGYRPNTINLNGQEYIVDKNGVPITPYTPIDGDREKYFNTSTINNRIEDGIKEEKAARKEFAAQGIADIFKTVSGSFSVMASIPMLVVSPKYGLGLGVYGIHALTSSLGRRNIKGAKQQTEKKKWTGKRLVFAWATAGISEGIANVKDNYNDMDYVLKTNYTQKMELLKSARVAEDKLAREIIALELDRKTNNTIDENASEKVQEAQAKMEAVAMSMDKQEFEKAVNLTLEKINAKEIEQIVTDYMTAKNIASFSKRDINSIAEILGKKVEKKYNGLTLNPEFADIVRDEIRDRVVTLGDYVVVGKTKVETSKVVQESSDTASSIREKYVRDNDKTTDDTKESMFGKDMTKKVNAGVEPDKKASSEKATVHIKDKDEFDKKEITEEELEQKVDKVVQNMGRSELIEVIDEALQRKDAVDREIKNPRYAQLMDRVAELNRIHSEFEKLTGEEMYLKYEVKDKKRHIKQNKDGDAEYMTVSEVVKEMREYLIKYINS